MTEIKNTTPNAISRKLKTVGFEKFNGKYGFEVFADNQRDFARKCIVVFNRDFSDTNQVAPELEAMGYVVENYSQWTTLVFGKVT